MTQKIKKGQHEPQPNTSEYLLCFGIVSNSCSIRDNRHVTYSQNLAVTIELGS
jgi:hypothetical protein